jgi:hypothetical protein
MAQTTFDTYRIWRSPVGGRFPLKLQHLRFRQGGTFAPWAEHSCMVADLSTNIWSTLQRVGGHRD